MQEAFIAAVNRARICLCFLNSLSVEFESSVALQGFSFSIRTYLFLNERNLFCICFNDFENTFIRNICTVFFIASLLAIYRSSCIHKLLYYLTPNTKFFFRFVYGLLSCKLDLVQHVFL